MNAVSKFNRNFRRLYAGYYESMFKDKICFYCGEPATSVDHSVPVAFYRTLYDICRPMGKKPLVPACRECNSIAGAKLFTTLGQKRRYVQDRIRHKYRKILKLPIWESTEVDDLGHELQSCVLNGVGLKTKTIRRLIWPHQSGGLREAVEYFYRHENRTAPYVPKPSTRKRDEYEQKLSPLLKDLDFRYAGALSPMVDSLNNRGIPTYERRDWSVSSLKKALWRLQIGL